MNEKISCVLIQMVLSKNNFFHMKKFVIYIWLLSARHFILDNGIIYRSPVILFSLRLLNILRRYTVNKK